MENWGNAELGVGGEAVTVRLSSTSCKCCDLSLFLFSSSWIPCFCVPQSTIVNPCICRLHLEDEQWWREPLIRHVVASLLRRLWALNEESWCKSWEVKVPEEVINIGYRVITGNFCRRSLQRDHSGRLKYLLLALCNYRKQTNKQKKVVIWNLKQIVKQRHTFFQDVMVKNFAHPSRESWGGDPATLLLECSAKPWPKCSWSQASCLKCNTHRKLIIGCLFCIFFCVMTSSVRICEPRRITTILRLLNNFICTLF